MHIGFLFLRSSYIFGALERKILEIYFYVSVRMIGYSS